MSVPVMPKAFVRYLLAAGLSFYGSWASTAEVEKLNVLVLSSFGQDYPSTHQLQTGLDEALGYTRGTNAVFFEYLDSPLLPETDVTRELDEFLTAKYQSVALDYVLAWAPSAAQFLGDHPELFPGVPRAFIEVSPIPPMASVGAGGINNVLDTALDYEKVLLEFERIRSPSVLYVVHEETDESSIERLENFLAAKQQVWPDTRMELLNGLSLSEVGERLSTADSGGVVIYLLAFSDGAGSPLTPYRYAQLMIESSPIPVFSFWDSLVGSGVVGGIQYSHQAIGRNVGLLLLERGAVQGSSGVESMTTTYDYAAMQRWKIDTTLIPRDAQVINGPENVLYRYRYQVAAVVAVLLVLSALSIGLARALAARRVALLLLQNEHDGLAETVAFRTRELRSLNSVLTAQNDELQRALHEVKVLKGIIPICSYCKKIRNDQGFWDMVESYLSKQADVRFSHGICPECMVEHRHEFEPGTP